MGNIYIMNLLAWETCSPYLVAALDKRSLVILNYYIGFFRTSKVPPPPIIPVPCHSNTTWVAEMVRVSKGKGLGDQLWWGHLGLAGNS